MAGRLSGRTRAAFLRSASEHHAEALRATTSAPTTDLWLERVLDFAPVNEALFLAYSILSQSPESGNAERSLERLCGADARERAYRLKEFDEYAAHSYANGVWPLREADAFRRYAANLEAFAARDGVRAARRRSIVDEARLIVPPAFGAAARERLAGIDL